MERILEKRNDNSATDWRAGGLKRPFYGFRRHRRYLPAALAVTALVAAACGSGQGSSSHSASSAPNTSQSKTSSNSSSGPPFVYAQSTTFGTTFSLNPFTASFMGALPNYAYLPLAFATTPKFGTYVPQMAKSWTMTPSKITLHLRTGAKWQDGSPFTSQDVMVSLLLDGTEGNSVWSGISNISAPNASTVVVDLKPGIGRSIILDDLLGVYPVPAKEYGRFVTPSLKQDLIKYYALSASKGSTAAANSSAGKAVSAVFKSAAKYAPASFVGDGPFQLVHYNSEAAIMRRWPGFWAASHVHVPAFEYKAFSSSQVTFGQMLSHKVDLAQAGAPASFFDRWKTTTNAHLVAKDSFSMQKVLFNDRHYPLSLPGVRQAIAYLINRPVMDKLEHGGFSVNRPVKVPDGLVPSLAKIYLTPAQLSSLNRYPYDPAKAASLLTGLGFHKRTGKWYMPNGKPFTLSLSGPTYPQPAAAMTVMAKMLTNFGITSSATAEESVTYYRNETSGNFEMAWANTGGGLNPLAGFASALVNLNFVSSGAHAGQPGMGFGPKVNVPGLGRVSVTSTLANEAATVDPGPQMRKLTWDWARLVNQQLPFLQLEERYQPLEYSTAKFTDWPPTSQQVWGLMGLNPSAGVVSAMEQGYIRPKSS